MLPSSAIFNSLDCPSLALDDWGSLAPVLTAIHHGAAVLGARVFLGAPATGDGERPCHVRCCDLRPALDIPATSSVAATTERIGTGHRRCQRGEGAMVAERKPAEAPSA